MDLYGPALPPGYVKPADDLNESEDDSSSYEVPTKKSCRVIGPQIPSDFLSKHTFSNNEGSNVLRTETSNTSNVIGPELPPSFQNQLENEDDFDEDVYGPVPAQSSNDSYDLYERKIEIEKRAENMKNKLENKPVSFGETLEREEWMVVPDTSRKNQLGAISRCLAPSSKTSSKEKHHHRHSEEDKKTSEELKKYNKSKRSESLMEMHKKKMKKKEKKEKDKPKERKAFDRDEMAVKHFTKDQVNSVIDKAKYLNSRFAPGGNQYL
ncbi:uncharacterized protein TNIN_164381 [Trichonephila inaurata madagascariensis]|uniref:DUF3752 domain-containing protein n=1 Tax=Trichonephila inaurata madagascariensis TaxID=2747483 RepID=A0A8X6YR69_9ARAC|nr:uncharacterized protein TNIN_164381 [Trichonephila inaurata madagascariensis]